MKILFSILVLMIIFSSILLCTQFLFTHTKVLVTSNVTCKNRINFLQYQMFFILTWIKSLTFLSLGVFSISQLEVTVKLYIVYY